EPARRSLRLAERLLQVELEPAGDDRPGADERLPDKVFLVGVFHPAGELAPAANALRPFVVQGGERPDSRADVSRAFRVVRLRGEECVRMTRESLERRAVETLGREREAVGVASHLVQRGEAEPAVEGRVLDALGHHGSRYLLPARDELRVLE